MGGRCLDREIVTVASHRSASHRIISSMLVCMDAHAPRTLYAVAASTDDRAGSVIT